MKSNSKTDLKSSSKDDRKFSLRSEGESYYYSFKSLNQKYAIMQSSHYLKSGQYALSTLDVWDVDNREFIFSKPINEKGNLFYWPTPDDHYFVVGEEDSGLMHLWDIRQSQQPVKTFRFQKDMMFGQVGLHSRTCTFLKNKRHFFSINYQGLDLWDIENTESKPVLKFNQQLMDKKFKSPYLVETEILMFKDNIHFIAGAYTKNSIIVNCIWNMNDLSAPVNFIHCDHVLEKITPLSNEMQFVASGNLASHSEIYFYDLNQATNPLATFVGPSGQVGVNKIMALPDGQHFIAHYGSGGTWLWNISKTNAPESRLHGGFHSGLDFSFLNKDGLWSYVTREGDGVTMEIDCVKTWIEKRNNFIKEKLFVPHDILKMILDYLVIIETYKLDLPESLKGKTDNFSVSELTSQKPISYLSNPSMKPQLEVISDNKTDETDATKNKIPHALTVFGNIVRPISPSIERNNQGNFLKNLS